MSSQSEDKNARRSLPGVSMDYPSFDWAEPPLRETTAAISGAESAQSVDVKQRLIDVVSKDLTHVGEGARTVVRKERKHAQRKEQASTETQAKPARAKRAKLQTADHVKDQAETVSRAKRTSTRKRAKAADDLDQTTPTVNNMPPIAAAAIEFLGAQDAQGPELIAPAQTANNAEGAKTKRVEQNVQEVENSIERSPVQLVMDAPQTPAAKQAVTSRYPTTADEESVAERLLAEQRSAASVSSTEKAALDPVWRLNLHTRLLFAIGRAMQRAGTWLQVQGREGQVPSLGAPVSLGKPPASTGPVVMITAVNDNSTVMPEAVARRFLKVAHNYYFKDRTPAFSDLGNTLVTRSTNPEVVRSLVEIAKARGWDTITVRGTEEFRRSAWMEAAQNGMTVAGYKPTEFDLAKMANLPAANTVEKRAMKKRSNTHVEPAMQTPVAQSTRIPTPAAGTEQSDLEQTEKAKAFRDNKPAFVVKKYPDLAAAYGVVAAAKAFAVEKLSESARDEFGEMARRHVIQKIAAGEQIKGPKIYTAPTKTTEVGDSNGLSQVAADLGKSARAKAVERER